MGIQLIFFDKHIHDSMLFSLLPYEVLDQISEHFDLSHSFFIVTRETAVTGGNRRLSVTTLATEMLRDKNMNIFEYIRKHQHLYTSIQKKDRRFAILLLEYKHCAFHFSQPDQKDSGMTVKKSEKTSPSPFKTRFCYLFVYLTHLYIRSSRRGQLINLHSSFTNTSDNSFAFWQLLNMCSLKDLYICKYRISIQDVSMPEYISELEI